MKRIILFILLFIPVSAGAQIFGTINSTANVNVATDSLSSNTPFAVTLTGSNRLTISADSTNTTYQTGLGNNLLFVGPANASALATGLIQFKNLSTFSTNSSGQSVFLAVTPTINSNTTGGNTDFLVNRAETSVGSGSQLLADFQVGNTSKFKIDNTGAATAVGGFISVGNSFLATINNTSTANNSRIQMLAGGTTLSRNVADNSTCFVVNQINAGSTGNVMDLQFQGVVVSSVNTLGDLRLAGKHVLREVAVADAVSITPNIDTTDVLTQINTQVAGTLTVNAPSGTAAPSQAILIRVKSTNAQTLSWNAIFRGCTTISLPAATSGSGKTDRFYFEYNNADTKWDIVRSNVGY